VGEFAGGGYAGANLGQSGNCVGHVVALRKAVTEVNSVTSVVSGCAGTLAGLRLSRN